MRSILTAILCIGLTGVVKATDGRWGQGCTYITLTKQIYCFGGEPFSDSNKQIPVYSLNVTDNSVVDISNPVWNTIEGVPNNISPSAASRFIFAAVPDTDLVYLKGGIVCTACTYNSGYFYNVTSNQWKKTNTETPVYAAAFTPVNNNLYYFGGKTVTATGFDTPKTILYNYVSSTVMKTGVGGPNISPLNGSAPIQDTWAASMVYSTTYSLLIIIGGEQGSEVSGPVAMDDIIAVNIKTNLYSKWNDTISTTGSLPPTRWAHSLIMDPTNTNAIMFGGCDNNGGAMNDLWLYNVVKRTWSPQKTTGTPPTPRCRHSAVVVGKYMFILFGGNNDVFNADINVALDMNTWEWTTAPVIGTPSISSSTSGSNSNPTSPGVISSNKDDTSGISGGAIAGIVVGAIAGVGIIGALFFFVFKRRNRYSNANNHSEDFSKEENLINKQNNVIPSQSVDKRAYASPETMVKPDQSVPGSALPAGRIILEPVKPNGIN
ncbi:hypothetical protein F4703DRAFT_1791810 [Phycomyces blakesleeanus]|uniref:Galactose oxidase n=1 Tax=Phycomyces blakesleeanus (strain ATCC 8743b / DSM 1359 / FGSC 10004 / NBRC 33097 / NRRL 1555) TaxID=763407 RepID=A0A167NNF9_PHYB8|nr:hypothetical protein PHYBLDRAFT_76081 [Phycomyces blakesleeanus NRRL 1555(-)]OAD76339.1 hypothetical protein PHYBLDRAFT_76081 [Phycomyces blakesleeanus NRRL 1555(-)]|eukprot:XP_018294379.1 hypothetical protein PHYBLDRAFT_76081 [Phycomyces blakesleeanus NRRL 1555(-)]